MELKNSTILITGGSSGIGLELVQQLIAQEAKTNYSNRKPVNHQFPSGRSSTLVNQVIIHKTSWVY